jgi:hypothetical protein
LQPHSGSEATPKLAWDHPQSVPSVADLPISLERFFDYISEEFDASPLFPALDGRDFPVSLFIEGVKAGSDVIPLRDFDSGAANEEPKFPE